MVGAENLKRIVDQICRDKGIDRALLIDAIEEAVRSAVRKKYGTRREIEVQFNEDLGEVEVFQYRTVVDEVYDEETEISLEEARRLDPEIELDDDLGEKMDNIADLGRIAAQSAKQVIIHRMRDAERDVIYEMFRDREGTIVNGIVQRFERGDMIINLGRTDAVLPREGQIPKRSYKQGDRIRAYLQEVRRDTREGKFRDSQLILSRTCNEFLIKLFEMEVPEIAEGIVKIMGASREPGFRAKIAVSSIESDVDPVGACVGLKGSRVQNVVQELQGERIDIVPWSPDPARYVCNALAPAEVSMVIVEDERKALLVVVPDDQLSLAIGRQGQNVRLASRLLGWKIDVKSQSRYANMDNTEYRSLLAVDGVDENLADRLFAAGITSAPLLAAMDIEQLMALARIDQDKAQGMQKAAAAMQPSKEKTAQPAPDVQELTDQEPVTPQEDQSIEQGG
ncbi:NusA antitermination factor [Desulfobulbus propionicus DSM 2032]|uniref:Transcription termination/antitermination protein NusA n=1 Tax=Desulfobulbus propionicus (strain ATCC 33891 / DSM 2032 / VKM B-1956 / 1pr3) TaxID=577650 RepID=A0A7U4DQC4_DESPD|nr:transcription termination factor NusA [Desulfobulbus propionicus]ADW19046.1 NusA antitermination factor [Desulfobulbus propionicus DSM 2032]